jgi:hypothetical protein
VVERTYIKKEEINQCLDDQDLGNKIPSCPVGGFPFIGREDVNL